MADRMFGIETEYALTAFDIDGESLNRQAALRRLMRCARERPHLLDGTGRGLFLTNGARFYIDVPDHPEFSTPEVTNPWDAVRYQLAGDRLMIALAQEVVAREARVADIIVLKGNVDFGGTGSTWGSHESLLHQTNPNLLPAQIIPHLVSRLIYTGAGGFNSRFLRGLKFTLSPRVWHLEHDISEQSTFARGIFHTKNESHSSSGFHRLHILCGESLCSESAAWLRVATTAIVVALIDSGLCPGDAVQLKDPLLAMRHIARDPTCRNAVESHAGGALTALGIQRHYLELAEAHVAAPFMPPWSREACRRWRRMLEQLEDAPGSVATELDWAIKLALYKDRARRRGIAWDVLRHWNHIAKALGQAIDRSSHPDKRPAVEVLLGPQSPIADDVQRLTPYLQQHGLSWSGFSSFVELRQELFEIDTRFAQLGDRGIFAALDRAGVLTHHVDGVDNIEGAIVEAPATGRARLRGRYVRELNGAASRYLCDWRGLWDSEEPRTLDLSNPFATAADWQPCPSDNRQRLDLRARLQAGIELY